MQKKEMNEIIDRLSDTMITMGREAKDKAMEAASLAKLRMDIRSRENYLNELYAELGKKYYTEHKDEEDLDFIEIENLSAEIDELRRELDTRRGAPRCPKCNAFIDPEADFCSKCGAKLKEEFTEDDVDVVDINKDENKNE